MPSERLAMQVLYSSTHCGLCSGKPSAVRFATIQQAQEAIGKSTNLPSPTTTGNPVLVLLCMGQQPTGGFSILPVASTFQVQDGLALLDVLWQKPGSDAFVTQAFTSPCLLLALEKGPYHTIKVRDQEAMTRLVIRIDHPR